MICDCANVGAAKDKIGYHRREDDVWTHALCDRPSRLYLKELLERMATHLILLQGGPLHNVLLEHDVAIDRKKILAMDNGQHVLDHIDEYRYTTEILVGGSGRIASIWVPKES